MGKGKSGELIRWGSQDNMERIGRRSRIHGITKTLRSNAARRFPLLEYSWQESVFTCRRELGRQPHWSSHKSYG